MKELMEELNGKVQWLEGKRGEKLEILEYKTLAENPKKGIALLERENFHPIFSSCQFFSSLRVVLLVFLSDFHFFFLLILRVLFWDLSSIQFGIFFLIIIIYLYVRCLLDLCFIWLLRETKIKWSRQTVALMVSMVQFCQRIG